MKKPKKSSRLKLYVWVGAFSDYYGGIAFALAHDVAEARRLIAKEWPNPRNAAREVKGPPTAVHWARPAAYVQSGGG